MAALRYLLFFGLSLTYLSGSSGAKGDSPGLVPLSAMQYDSSDEVVIQENQRIQIDADVHFAKGLRIKSRAFVTLAAKNLTITTSHILVEGILQIGTEQCPFSHRAKIVLVNSASDVNSSQQFFGRKVTS
jgi:hypothetical protein